jgi:hypothetical protein
LYIGRVLTKSISMPTTTRFSFTLGEQTLPQV